jgi:FkbM family methyltransferase
MGGPRTPVWRDSFGKRLSARLVYPLFMAINRPGMRWFGHAVYDFALRCNGIAINFPGKHGLTIGEENFLIHRLRQCAGGVLLDVGANHGAYARHMLKLCPQAHVFAFEPHPHTFATLTARTADMAGITPVNMAVSETQGTLLLYDFATADGSTQASLGEKAVKFFADEVVTHAVTVTTIDAFMAEHGIAEITLLKIDTEGFDLAVLKGARAALAARAIRAIQFEFIPADIAMHVTMRNFFEVLEGYRIFRLCMNGALMPLDPYDVKRCEIYVTQNLIALPE